MRCYIARKVDKSFETVLERTREVLRAEGFKVVSELDLKNAPLPNRDDAGEEAGATTPKEPRPRRLLMAKDENGAMLPCNLVVRQTAEGIEVSAVDPQEELGKVGPGPAAELAKSVRDKLQSAIDAI